MVICSNSNYHYGAVVVVIAAAATKCRHFNASSQEKQQQIANSLIVCLECGSYCDACDLNGIGRCDIDRCNSTGLTTGVVYSNESQSCVRKCPAYIHTSALFNHFIFVITVAIYI